MVAPTTNQLQTFVHLLGTDAHDLDLDALKVQRHQCPFNMGDRATGWKIDFIIRKFRALGEESVRRRAPLDLQAHSCLCREC